MTLVGSGTVKPRSNGPPRISERSAFRLATTFAWLVTLPLCALWYLSPLALGFRQGPADPVERYWLDILYLASIYAGIPVVMTFPLVALLLDAAGFRIAARLLLIVAFVAMSMVVAVVLIMWR